MPSPKPDIKADQKVKKYRDEKGLTFREIASITQEDVKNVYNRYKRAVGELSTPK